MRIKEIKLNTLKAYRDVLRAQSCGKKDRFVDGLAVAYSLTLNDLGYERNKALNLEFICNEIKKLEKQA